MIKYKSRITSDYTKNRQLFTKLTKEILRLPAKRRVTQRDIGSLFDLELLHSFGYGNFFDKLRLSTFVGSKLLVGNAETLKTYVDEKLVVPVKLVVKNGKKTWQRCKLEDASNYFVPVRRPTCSPLYSYVHGRAIFVEKGSRTYFFKGVGTGFGEKNFKRIKRFKSHSEIWGGEFFKSAKYSADVGNSLREEYERLSKKETPIFKELQDLGAYFFPGAKDFLIFQPKQVPVIQSHENMITEDEKERSKNLTFVKARYNKDFYDLGDLKKQQVIYAYSLRCPFRLGQLKFVGPQRFFEYYDISANKEGDIFWHDKKIESDQLHETMAKSFTARQVMNYLLLHEINAVGRTSDSGGLSIFSEHNTTVAGENLDYDTVAFESDKNEKERIYALDKEEIRRNVMTMSGRLLFNNGYSTEQVRPFMRNMDSFCRTLLSKVDSYYK
jgi:hypothetical protein